MIEKTVLWYKSFYKNNNVHTMDDFNHYIGDAKKKNLAWSTL